MLTDIFANRYANVPIWSAFDEPERRLLVQGFRILTEEICPYWRDGKEHEYGKSFWTDLHRRLSMELGLSSLSPLAYSYATNWMGKPHTISGTWTMDKVCENWMFRPFDGSQTADAFMGYASTATQRSGRPWGRIVRNWMWGFVPSRSDA